MARRVTNSAPSSQSSRQAHDHGDDSVDEVTRCICGNDEFVSTPRTKALNASPGLYVQCETCNVWQHGFCMGFMAEKDVPHDYHCELCRPSFHRIMHRHGVLISKYTAITQSPDESSVENIANSDETGTDSTNNARSPAELEPNHKDDQSHFRRPPRKVSNGISSLTESQASNGHSKETPEEGSGLTIKSENGVSHDHENEAQSPLSLKALQPGLSEDPKKRPKRSSGESEANGAPRNRKRRSREDEILQRVLEESAREAREAEARRRSVEGGSIEDDDKKLLEEEVNARQDRDNNEDGEEQESVARPSRSRRARNTASTAEAKKVETSKPGSVEKASRGGRAARGGGRRGARVGANAAETNQTDSSSRRTANGVKKCKPRIPSLKTTFDEMRKRVSTILEFASKTQDEIHAEQKHGIEALQHSVTANKFDIPFKHLSKMCDRNSAYLEDLTRRLLKWEEQFGVNKSP